MSDKINDLLDARCIEDLNFRESEIKQYIELAKRLRFYEILWYLLKSNDGEIDLSNQERIIIRNMQKMYDEFGDPMVPPPSTVEECQKMLSIGTFSPKMIFYSQHLENCIYRYIDKCNFRKTCRINLKPKYNIVVFSGAFCNMETMPSSEITICCGNCPDLEKFANRSGIKIMVEGPNDQLTEDFRRKVVVLKNESFTVNGINFYGVSMLPRLEMKEKVKIPENTNVLISHVPPWGVGDYNTIITKDTKGTSGDLYLRSRVENLNLDYHVFGGCYNIGTYKIDGKKAQFVNCCNQHVTI